MKRAISLCAFLAAHASGILSAHANDAASLAPSQEGAEATKAAHVDWLVRFHLGLRTVTSSPEQDLLNLDGYAASPRFVVAGEYARLLSPAIALSGWTDFSIRSTKADGGGPKMVEDVFMLGAGLPLMPVGWESTALLVVPRFGYGWSWMSIGGHPESVGAPVYGGDLVVAWPKAHLSVSFGWLNGPTRPPGQIGRDSNFGGLSFLVGGVIDG